MIASLTTVPWYLYLGKIIKNIDFNGQLVNKFNDDGTGGSFFLKNTIDSNGTLKNIVWQITIVEVYCDHTIQYLVKQNPIWLFLKVIVSKISRNCIAGT